MRDEERRVAPALAWNEVTWRESDRALDLIAIRHTQRECVCRAIGEAADDNSIAVDGALAKRDRESATEFCLISREPAHSTPCLAERIRGDDDEPSTLRA